MTRISVSDTGSNTNENIVRAVKAIGKSKERLAVFEAIYFHKTKEKSVSTLMKSTGLSRKQVLTHGKNLVGSELVDQVKIGSETGYRTRDFYQHHKPKILNYVTHPNRLKNLPTKQDPKTAVTVNSLVRRVERQPRTQVTKQRLIKADLKIAFLVTNPERKASLQTAIEARDVEKAIKASANGPRIDVKLMLAPTFDDLIDALNSYKPHIVHFSGHGGGESLLFDNDRAGQDGGTVLDFSLISKLLACTAPKPKPKLIVLAACDTLNGAEKFLESVQAVVAMSDSIDDDAACDFSVRFYKSIASSAGLLQSVNQAKILLASKGYQDADLPTLLTQKKSLEETKFI